MLVFLALLAATALWGCTRVNQGYEDDSWTPDRHQTGDRSAPGDGDMRIAQDHNVPLPDKPSTAKPVGVDVLVVVDNSPGMEYAQLWLGRDLAHLISGLESLPGGPNYRIGVVSTDMGIGTYATANCTKHGDNGTLQWPGDCPLPANGVRYLQGYKNNVNTPVSADEAVACMTRLGVGGCGFERTLEAVRTSLSSGAKGFIRGKAALAVIILSNEDDCSAKQDSFYDPSDPLLGPLNSYRCFQFGVTCAEGNPPLYKTTLTNCSPGQDKLHVMESRYVSFLKSLKPDGWVSVLVISGPPQKYTEVNEKHSNGYKYWEVESTCTNKYQSGDPGFRLRAFAKSFGGRGFVHDICINNYKTAMTNLFNGIKAAF